MKRENKPEKRKVGRDWPKGTQIPYGCEIHNNACDEWEAYLKTRELSEEAVIKVLNDCYLGGAWLTPEEATLKRAKAIVAKFGRVKVDEDRFFELLKHRFLGHTDKEYSDASKEIATELNGENDG